MDHSTSLRILEVAEPSCDGVFIHVRGLLRYLVGHRHRVAYAYSSRRACSQLGELLAELRTKDVACYDLKIGNMPGLEDFGAVLHLVKIILRERPQIVHAHSSKAGALVRMVAVFLRGPVYLYSPHAYYSMAEKPKGWRIVFWWVERVLAPFAVTVNISRDERNFAREQLGVRGDANAVIANPVDISEFVPATPESRRKAREKVGFPQDAILIGTVGRLTAQKNPLALYRAFEQLARHEKRVVLCHLGVGELEEERNAWMRAAGLEDRVRTVPYLANPREFYQALDVFALSSRFEAGWPIVLVEALATGLPVVTTRFVGAGAYDFAELSQACIASDDGKESLAAALEIAVSSLNGEQLNNHRSVADKVFSIERCYGAIEDLYRRLLSPTKVSREL